MKVYNTLSGQKEEFLPRDDVVKMYVCGITPYDDSHIGHAMSYIIFDVIQRYLQFKGYKVKYVQNITDIDDKLIGRADRLGISVSELAKKFTDSYFEDMDALNIGRADIYPRATEEISKIIEVIQGLIEKGHAYTAAGSVYFRVNSIPDYGKLSHRNLESMMSGGNLKYLGDTLDIHGGGQDLVFPHHENEIAQSESFTGIKPFVKYWLHNGMVQLGEEKMSKSVGNLITVKETLGKYSADAIRIFVLSSHYRGPLTYSEEALKAAEGGVERLLRVISRDDPTGGVGKSLEAEPYRKQFIEAMDDDFNTPRALAVLFDLAREINQAGDSGLSFLNAQEALSRVAKDALGLKLGILITPPTVSVEASALAPTVVIGPSPTQEAELRVNRLVEERLRFRNAKQWQRADEIRAKLAELGIALEDTPEGTKRIWKRTPAVEALDKLLAELGIAL